MKKIVILICAITITYAVSAQISVGINGNYTMYKQDFQKSTSGGGVRIYYQPAEKYSLSLGFTYGAPIKTASEVVLQNSTGDETTVPSEIKYNFKTFSLLGHYNFLGDDESTGKFYGSFGAGFVLVNYKENIKGSYDPSYTPIDQVSGNANGLTINLGLGGEYKLGTPSVFAEAGLALPANKVGDTYVENVIPTHFVFNVGVKIPLGGNSDY